MNCEEIRELASDYLDRRLAADQATALETHLKRCPGCLEEIETLRATVSFVSSLGCIEPSADFLTRLNEKLERGGGIDWFWAWLFKPIKVKVPLEICALTILALLALHLAYRSEDLPRESRLILPERQPSFEDKSEKKVLPETGTVPARPQKETVGTTTKSREGYGRAEPEAKAAVEAELSRPKAKAVEGERHDRAALAPQAPVVSSPQPAVIELAVKDVPRFAERMKAILERRGGSVLAEESAEGSDLRLTIELPQSRQAEFLAALREEADAEAREAPRPALEQEREKAPARKELSESLSKLRQVTEIARSKKAAPAIEEEGRKTTEFTVRLQLHIRPKK